jgi:hypothetical protein
LRSYKATTASMKRWLWKTLVFGSASLGNNREHGRMTHGQAKSKANPKDLAIVSLPTPGKPFNTTNAIGDDILRSYRLQESVG